MSNMVKFISYTLAIIITAILAVILYPIAAICWIFSQIGKASTFLLKWTNKTIQKLWDDIRNSNQYQSNDTHEKNNS